MQDWRPADSAGASYIYGPMHFDAAVLPFSERTQDYVGISPDGRHLFTGIRRGDLACDCAKYTLEVYSVEQLKNAVAARVVKAPRALAAVEKLGIIPMRSVTHRSGYANQFAAIRLAEWEDNSTIRYTGYDDMGRTGVYRLNIDTGHEQQLLQLEDKPEAFLWSYAVQGDALVYSATHEQPKLASPTRYPVWRLEGDAREWLRGEVLQPHLLEVFTAFGGNAPRRVLSYPLPWKVNPWPSKPVISPDGRWAVVVAPAFEERGNDVRADLKLPDGWERYPGLEKTEGVLGRDVYFKLWRYMLLDLVGNAPRRILVDAPRGPLSLSSQDARPIAWSADSKHIALANVQLPLSMQNKQPGMGYLVDYDVDAAKWAVVEPMADKVPEAGGKGVARKIDDVAWLPQGRELLVRYAGPDGKPVATAVLGENHVTRAASAADLDAFPEAPPTPQLAEGLKVELRTVENDGPRLIASDGVREVSILGDDPALKGVWRTPMQTVKWTERNGHVEEGRLLLPRSAKKGKRLPLVVEVDGAPGFAFPDGGSSTAMAAQSLAAEGIAVLRIDARLEKDYPEADPQLWLQDKQTQPLSKIEPVLIRERIDAAVKKLADDGIIDPKRVGIIGFSRTGYYTSYLISHPKGVTPAAAIIADSTTVSYGEYIQSEAYSGIVNKPITTKGMEWAYGGPFWKNKQLWIEEAPFFNIEKVESPALFTFNGSENFGIGSPVVEILTGYRMNNRPVDIQLFRGGSHQLQRPQQQCESLQLTVDWMNFWLRDVENPDPARAGQFRYWRKLKAQRDARLAEKNPTEKPTH